MKKILKLGPIGFLLLLLSASGPSLRAQNSTQPEKAWSQQHLFAFEKKSTPESRLRVTEGLDLSAEKIGTLGLTRFSRWAVTDPDSGDQLGETSIYQMRDPAASFLLYVNARQQWETPKSLLPELEAWKIAENLILWQGRFFCRFQATAPELDLDLLATEFALALDEPLQYPLTVAQLPEANLRTDSIRFHLSAESLRAEADFPADLIDILGFDEEAEVTAAEYDPSGRTFFVIGYPTAGVAEKYFGRLQFRLDGIFSEEGFYSKRTGPIIGLFEGSEVQAHQVLEPLQYKASVKWVYDRDPTLEERKERRAEYVGFFGVVTASILMTGVFIVFVLVFGLLAGVARYEILKRFPMIAARDQMTRLDL